jgi:hypothetical protein
LITFWVSKMASAWPNVVTLMLIGDKVHER